MKRLLAVVGPTASGKTALSIRLAKEYNGEIVSADSMQIYTGMDIATAKPTKEEMDGIPHHLMDFLSPTESFSVSQYVEMAKNAIDEILSKGKLPPEQTDEKLRAELNERYQTEGGESLLKELSEFDPETAQKLHPSNSKRIIRAIEIYRTTGITMSEQVSSSKRIPSPYDVKMIGI